MTDPALPAALADVLAFWLGRPTNPDYGERKQFWFQSTPALDREIAGRFLDTHERAVSGTFADAAGDPAGCLALILLLDQMPRNMFRAAPRSFATDAQARTLAERAIAAGFDRGYAPLHRTFFYLPFEHSEALNDQDRAVALFEALPAYELRERSIQMVHRHREIIARFGRFPHRNEILGRPSTAAELAFLNEPDSSFIYPRRADGTPNAEVWRGATAK
ncbi:MAG: DUF924 domain-containing protein [Alphaproteobacteria bacterium]|nr:DUF924 domain-containing protein [Alphaproteobacteria bacterium]